MRDSGWQGPSLQECRWPWGGRHGAATSSCSVLVTRGLWPKSAKDTSSSHLPVSTVGGWRGGGKEGWKNGWRGECLTWPDSYFCNSRTFGVNEFIPFLRGYLLTIYCEPAPQLRPGLWQSSDPRDFLDSGNQAEVDAVLHSRLPHSVTGGVTGAEETPRPARAWEGSRRRCRPG